MSISKKIMSVAAALKVKNIPEERTEVSDKKLVRLAKKGDKASFMMLVRRYQNRALAVATGLVNNREEAEDITQDAFLKAYRNLESFRGSSSFYTWLYRIIYNLSIDHSRKSYRKAEFGVECSSTLDASYSYDSESRSPVVVNPPPCPEKELDRRQMREDIVKAIGALSHEHRSVIILRELEGLSYDEISSVVGCTKGTVMSRLFHARKNLQTLLSQYSK